MDVDDTIIEVHGHAKQGVGFGCTQVRGLNALLATLTIAGCTPVIVAQRLRRGAVGSPRGAKRLIADALAQARRILAPGMRVLVRMARFVVAFPVPSGTNSANDPGPVIDTDHDPAFD